MPAFMKGDRVWWLTQGEWWEITHLWDTNTEGLRADLKLVAQPRTRASANVTELVHAVEVMGCSNWIFLASAGAEWLIFWGGCSLMLRYL